LTKQELDIAKRQASEVVSRNEGLEEENKQLRTASEALEAVGEDNVRLKN
jgi:hypothetical protein